MQLISVDSARHSEAEGAVALTITADLDDGAGNQSLPFGWVVGDPHGLGPQVDAWMAAHPDFPIAAYVAPTPSTNPADYDLSKRQICAALILSGTTTDPDGYMTGIIGHITDSTARALALNDWNNAPFYVRDNPLFNDADLLAAAGLTSAQVDGIWMLAKGQPR